MCLCFFLLLLLLQGTLDARRKAVAFLRTDDALHKVFTTMAERYKLRNGGYVRISPPPLSSLLFPHLHSAREVKDQGTV